VTRLAGRIAIVTGTSRGIGLAVAIAFRQEKATVYGCSRSEGCDVSQEADVERLFSQLRRQEDRLDILVNNAGILAPRKPMAEVTAREWDESMAANLRSVFLCTRAALKIMVPQGFGLIINLSSGAGKRAAPAWGPYAVAKWGVEGLTRAVAAEVESAGVRVVAVNPGGTRTSMRARAYPEEDPATVKTPEELAGYFVALAAGDIAFTSGDSLDYPTG
jgi:NAD(P)-dependent dehydrogenase (short-subunit alcohol dehydrogenase family)